MNQTELEDRTGELADLPNINPFPLFKCDLEGSVRFMNVAAENLLAGLNVRRENASQIFPGDFREQVRAILSRKSGIVTKEVGVGSGIGPAICYQIVRDHNGRIEVTSGEDKGTTFTVYLPAHQVEVRS